MNYLTIFLTMTLITAYAVLSYFQLKKLKGKVVQIMKGKLENKQLSKLINRARTSGRNQFSIFMIYQGLVFSLIFTIVLMPIDLLISSTEFDITKFIFIFLFLDCCFSLNAIARANTIWELSILKNN